MHGTYVGKCESCGVYRGGVRLSHDEDGSEIEILDHTERDPDIEMEEREERKRIAMEMDGPHEDGL
jgi:hypothetical protein